eukprot:596270-Rhodomonas_salina.1
MGHPAVLPAYGCPTTSAVLTACMVLQMDNILVVPLQWPMPPGMQPAARAVCSRSVPDALSR